MHLSVDRLSTKRLQVLHTRPLHTRCQTARQITTTSLLTLSPLPFNQQTKMTYRWEDAPGLGESSTARLLTPSALTLVPSDEPQLTVNDTKNTTAASAKRP
ncbi:hypothetical protein M8818_001000 [Zalaria obscura]|uniref:Uncharacterized protein n=1 Tax=Zalaria obscura TaxID=2024903 RepID=A0ACC3SM16_9PEZI